MIQNRHAEQIRNGTSQVLMMLGMLECASELKIASLLLELASSHVIPFGLMAVRRTEPPSASFTLESFPRLVIGDHYLD